MTHLDEKALAAKAWADLEMAASATGALEVARITLPIEKVRALVNERSALSSSPVSEWTAHLERVASSLEKNGFSLEAEDCQALSSTLTTLSVRNAELERGIDRLAAYIMENVPGEPSENQGAVDTAIRLLGKNAELEREVKRLREALSGCFCPRPVNAREYGFTVGECVAAGECGCCDGETLRSLSTSPRGGEHE